MRNALLGIALIPLMCATALAAPLLPTDWSGWQKTTTIPLNYRIPGHEDHFRIPFINAIGAGAKPQSKDAKLAWDYPKGTIIVKEVYEGAGVPQKGEKPFRLYGMIKDPANPKARGGWVWVLRDMKSGKETVYDSPLCIDCHSYANGKHPYGDKNPDAEYRDYVYFPLIRKSP